MLYFKGNLEHGTCIIPFPPAVLCLMAGKGVNQIYKIWLVVPFTQKFVNYNRCDLPMVFNFDPYGCFHY